MKYVEKMKPILHEAGKIVMSYFRKDVIVHRKKDQSPVTEADVASEKWLKEQLSLLIPGSGFIAEESGSREGNEYSWVIDPVDGTKNFSRGLPYFCISVALMKQNELVAAIIYAPALNEWFYTEKGAGCWFNGHQVTIDRQRWKKEGALVGVSDFRVRDCKTLSEIKRRFKEKDAHVRFRVCGAAALDLAYVAVGCLDAVLFENLGWWDAAAGALLIQEAGSIAQQYDGSELTKDFKTLLAGSQEITDLIFPAL